MSKIPKRASNRFTCDGCHERFDYSTEWTEQDAIDEYKRDHPETQHHAASVLCDDCHIKFKKWFATLTPAQKKKMREDWERENL